MCPQLGRSRWTARGWGLNWEKRQVKILRPRASLTFQSWYGPPATAPEPQLAPPPRTLQKRRRALPQTKVRKLSRRRTVTPPPGRVHEYACALEEEGPARGAALAAGEKRRGVSASGGRRKLLSPG